jgi:uncharacterized protein YndB with AHSA1/START domain
MAGLYAKQTISIAATPEVVWSVLTQSEFTRQWVGAFQPVFARLESDWKIGSPVAWQNYERQTLADGVVTAVTPNKSLAYSVHDVSDKFDDVQSDEDGIFYDLAKTDGSTSLTVRQGDFSKVGERGKEFCDATTESWKRALPAIKQLAESMKT